MRKDERKRAQLEHAQGMSDGAKLIKLADKLHNCSSLLDDPPPHWRVQQVQGYMILSKAFVDKIHGTNKGLEEQLDIVFNSEWSYADKPDVKYPCIPKDEDSEVLLETYLVDCARGTSE